MSAALRDNAETRQTMAIIRAMTKCGPTPWAGNPPVEAKNDKPSKVDFDRVEWAILVTSRRAQLFKRTSLRNGVMTLKSASEDGTPLLRGPQYQMSARDLRGPEWRLYASYADAANDLVEYF